MTVLLSSDDLTSVEGSAREKLTRLRWHLWPVAWLIQTLLIAYEYGQSLYIRGPFARGSILLLLMAIPAFCYFIYGLVSPPGQSSANWNGCLTIAILTLQLCLLFGPIRSDTPYVINEDTPLMGMALILQWYAALRWHRLIALPLAVAPVAVSYALIQTWPTDLPIFQSILYVRAFEFSTFGLVFGFFAVVYLDFVRQDESAHYVGDVCRAIGAAFERLARQARLGYLLDGSYLVRDEDEAIGADHEAEMAASLTAPVELGMVLRRICRLRGDLGIQIQYVEPTRLDGCIFLESSASLPLITFLYDVVVTEPSFVSLIVGVQGAEQISVIIRGRFATLADFAPQYEERPYEEHGREIIFRVPLDQDCTHVQLTEPTEPPPNVISRYRRLGSYGPMLGALVGLLAIEPAFTIGRLIFLGTLADSATQTLIAGTAFVIVGALRFRDVTELGRDIRDTVFEERRLYWRWFAVSATILVVYVYAFPDRAYFDTLGGPYPYANQMVGVGCLLALTMPLRRVLLRLFPLAIVFFLLAAKVTGGGSDVFDSQFLRTFAWWPYWFGCACLIALVGRWALRGINDATYRVSNTDVVEYVFYLQEDIEREAARVVSTSSPTVIVPDGMHAIQEMSLISDQSMQEWVAERWPESRVSCRVDVAAGDQASTAEREWLSRMLRLVMEEDSGGADEWEMTVWVTPRRVAMHGRPPGATWSHTHRLRIATAYTDAWGGVLSVKSELFGWIPRGRSVLVPVGLGG